MTIWVPLDSLKSVRLGATRFQRCPVENHCSRTQRVDPSTLSPEQAAQAASVHDRRMP